MNPLFYNLKFSKIFDIIIIESKKGNIMEAWAIIRVKTGELIMVYSGTFKETMKYLSNFYEDGEVDIEPYEEWLKEH